MEGQGSVDYKVVGWDWTGNIGGSGSSYFSSICMGRDSSIYLLGHYAGGLKVEDVEVFSSVEEDVFLVKYDKAICALLLSSVVFAISREIF